MALPFPFLEEYEDEDSQGPHVNHELYPSLVEEAISIRDALIGEKRIKQKSDNYLPVPGGMKSDLEKRDSEYDQYKERAEYPQVVKRTSRAIIDRVFSKPTERKIDPFKNEIDSMDNNGMSFDEFERWVFSEAVAINQCGVLVDLAEDEESIKFKRYPIENIYNWMHDKEGNLILVVLKENKTIGLFFNKTPIEARRVIALVDEFVYSFVYVKQERVDDDGKIRIVWTLEDDPEAIKPLSGKTELREIPFKFICGDDPEESLLEPLVNLATHYYRVSADYRHILHKSSFPQWWMSVNSEQGGDVTIKDDLDFFGEPLPEDGSLAVEVGSSRMLMIRGGEIGVTEPQGSSVSGNEKAIERITLSMSAYGAKIFNVDAKSNKAAETVWMESSGHATTVSSIANLVSRGIADCFYFAGLWRGLDDSEFKNQLNTDYFDEQFTPADIPNLMEGIDGRLIAMKDAREYMRRGDFPLRPDEEMDADIERAVFDQEDMIDGGNEE